MSWCSAEALNGQGQPHGSTELWWGASIQHTGHTDLLLCKSAFSQQGQLWPRQAALPAGKRTGCMQELARNTLPLRRGGCHRPLSQQHLLPSLQPS